MQLPKARTILLTALTAVTLSVTGCVADPEIADTLPDSGSAPTHVAETSLPDTDAGNMSQWVVDEINGTRAINKQDWYPRVSPEMSDDIPVDSLVGTLNADLRPSLPFVAAEYSEPEENYGVTRLSPDLTSAPIDLHVKVDDTGRISDLWYEEVVTDANQEDSPSDTDEEAVPGEGLGQ